MNGFVSLDTASPVPPFEQIRSRVAELIVSGTLAGGQRLPTVRQLAGDLRVAPGTVARAYKELETAGLLVTRRGAGTRVAPGWPTSASERPDLLARVMGGAVGRARALGFSDAEIAGCVERELGRGAEDSRAEF